MRSVISILALIVVAGCSGVPPKPPLPVGDYRPINKPVEMLPAVTPRPAYEISE